MSLNYSQIFSKQFELFYTEDDLNRNINYMNSLPSDTVHCKLKLKDDLVLAGLPFFFEAFNFISDNKISYQDFLKYEGEQFNKADNSEIEFQLPFNIALTGERIALNILQRTSSIATYTKKFVDTAEDIKILDTRKTTPGLRAFEKYAVVKGGGYNHRYGQGDAWMVKDNHKSFYGGVENAIKAFQDLNTFYQPIIVEIHDLEELKFVSKLNVKHFMLDNFTPEKINEAISIKKEGWTYEVSGGVNLDNLKSYCINGVDAISTGSIIYNAPQVDISLKYNR